MKINQIASSVVNVLSRNTIIFSTIILLGTNCTTNKINNNSNNDSICVDSCQDELVEENQLKHNKHADFSLLGVHIGDNEDESIHIWENMGLKVEESIPISANSKIDFMGVPIAKEVMWTLTDNTVASISLETPLFNTEKEALHYYNILVPQIKDIASRYENIKKIESEYDDYKNFVEGTDFPYFELKDVCYYDECLHAISVTLKVQLKDRTIKYDSKFARTHWYVMISLGTMDENDEDFIKKAENAEKISNQSTNLDYDIIGKWELGNSNSLFVIYMKNNKYFGNNIDNGVLCDNEFELKKTIRNGRTVYIPVHIDSWSETYELRENGIYIKNVDGTGGQIFYNAK